MPVGLGPSPAGTQGFPSRAHLPARLLQLPLSQGKCLIFLSVLPRGVSSLGLGPGRRYLYLNRECCVIKKLSQKGTLVELESGYIWSLVDSIMPILISGSDKYTMVTYHVSKKDAG